MTATDLHNKKGAGTKRFRRSKLARRDGNGVVGGTAEALDAQPGTVVLDISGRMVGKLAGIPLDGENGVRWLGLRLGRGEMEGEYVLAPAAGAIHTTEALWLDAPRHVIISAPSAPDGDTLEELREASYRHYRVAVARATNSLFRGEVLGIPAGRATGDWRARPTGS